MRVKKEIEKKIISKYCDDKFSMNKISIEFGISITTVFNILKRNNIKTRTHGGINKINEDYVIGLYKNGKSCQKIAENFNVSFGCIRDILKKNNVERNNIYHNLTLDENYWSVIDRYDKAYFLGLMITDGNVIGNSVKLQLNIKDRNIIELFSKKTKNSNKLSFDKRGNGMIGCGAKRKKWVEDLAKYGVVPNKTYKAYLPNISEEMTPHLLRGIIDGDGWISSKRTSIGLCGNKDLVEQVRNYFVEKLNVYKVKVLHTKPHLWMIQWSSRKDFIKICKFIYKDKNDCYLLRKFQNYQNIIQANTEVTSEIAKGSEVP